MRVGLLEFIVVGFYLVIWKAIFQLINIECRRNGLVVPAGVSGLLA
jgi:hypothetical protein